MTETDIAWKSGAVAAPHTRAHVHTHALRALRLPSTSTDIDNKFANYNQDKCTGATEALCPADVVYPHRAQCTESPPSAANKNGVSSCTCANGPVNGAAGDQCIKYLWQSYPGIIPKYPKDPLWGDNMNFGVQNEHFIVWMRTAGLPNFRKLYGKISTPVKKGTVLTFTVATSETCGHFATLQASNPSPLYTDFAVDSFGGKKSLVLSTTSWFGGKNPFLVICAAHRAQPSPSA
jgi:hypothetical protein